MGQFRNVEEFLLMAVLFGTAFPAIKAGLASLPPLLFAAGRFSLSAILLLAYAGLTAERWLPRSGSDWRAVTAGGSLFVGGAGLLFVGQQYTTSGVAAVLFTLVPVFTVAVAWVLLPGERPTHRGLLGVVVGFAGAVVVIGPGPGGLLATDVLGEGLILLAAASVALGGVLVRRIHPSMPVVPLTAWAMVVGASIQLAVGLATGESLADASFTAGALLALAYLAVGASGVGFVIYFVLLDRLGALEVNLVTYAVPVVATAVGWLLLGEPVSRSAAVGFFVILAGFFLLEDRAIAAELARFRGAGR